MADKKQYQWDKKARRFRGPDGRFIGAQKIRYLRDDVIRRRVAVTDALTKALYAGEISPVQFTYSMRTALKNTTMMEYMLGRGGRHVMTQSDYGRVGHMLKVQYGYLDGFTRDIIDGKLTLEQAQARAQLYVDSTRYAHERGKAASYGITVPEYPGLHPNCQCYLTIQEQRNGDVHVYWRIGSANPCAECLAKRDEYNPYVISRSGE